MRVMAMYLPQYHTFRENDEWWGEGYTEWTAVKRARPLFKGHVQPRVPLDNRYYNLVQDGVETLRWQAAIAKEHGIYGFSIYHYYFKGKQLMQRPMEILLENPDIDINYCICWANETWTRTWYGLKEDILMKQEYGNEEDFRDHYNYLRQFFLDKRYIKVCNKPVLQIYRTFEIDELAKMLECFKKWAKVDGFDGIYIVSGKTASSEETRKELIDGYYYFEPGYTLKHDFSRLHRLSYEASVFIKSAINRLFKKTILERKIPSKWILDCIAKREYRDNEFPGIIPNWDNTPRRDYKGLVYTGTNPQDFKRVLGILKEKKSNSDTDFVFVNAFNEWGEGAVLEPDTVDGFNYLDAIKEVVSS